MNIFEILLARTKTNISNTPLEKQAYLEMQLQEAGRLRYGAVIYSLDETKKLDIYIEMVQKELKRIIENTDCLRGRD